MELLKLHNTNRIDYNDRKWNTIVFFQTLVTALLVAVTVLVMNFSKDIFFGLVVIIVLLFIVHYASQKAIENLKRESELLFHEEYQMFKYAKLLGINEEIPQEKRLLIDDKWLFSDKWQLIDIDRCFPAEKNTSCGLKNYKDWLKCRMEQHSFLSIFEELFNFEGKIAIVLCAFFFVTFVYFLGQKNDDFRNDLSEMPLEKCLLQCHR